MYKYSSIIRVEDVIEACEEFVFQIVLKENMPFKIIDCYFQIKKNHDYRFAESDYLIVLYFSEDKNMELAREKIKKAVEFFVFLTRIPFAVNSSIVESVGNDIPTIDVNQSKGKMLNIEECNKIYARIRKKKKLLENVLEIYALAMKEDYLLAGNKEDAFFTYFKIIEVIVKDEFFIEKNSINKGQDCTKRYIEQMLSNVYNLETQENRLNELAGLIKQIVFEQTFDKTYHKIMWFLKRKNIFVNKNIVSSIVTMRNDIAHGQNVIIKEDMDEYKNIIILAKKVIEAKFFGRKMEIVCRQIVL